MNQLILIGRATKEPEMKVLPNSETTVTEFDMAVDRAFTKKGAEKESDFFKIKVWGRPAEFVANNLHKGKLCAVNGRINSRKYTKKDGTDSVIWEVTASEVKVLEWGQKLDFQDMKPIDDDLIPF